jgi:hypothetical protein
MVIEEKQQVTEYKTMLHILFNEWVKLGFKDGINELDKILKSNADLDGVSTKDMDHLQLMDLICEIEVLLVQFGLYYNENERIDE